jgi:hypothetical protein
MKVFEPEDISAWLAAPKQSERTRQGEFKAAFAAKFPWQKRNVNFAIWSNVRGKSDLFCSFPLTEKVQ